MKKTKLIGINIVDLYYCGKPQITQTIEKIIGNLYTLGRDNEYCILGEKGVENYLNKIIKIIEEYLNNKNKISEVLIAFINKATNVLCFDHNDCNPNNKCVAGCIVVNKHESHHLTCCVGRGIAGVLTVRAGCSKGCSEGVSAKEVDGELVCDNFFRCKPIDSSGCWLYCYKQ